MIHLQNSSTTRVAIPVIKDAGLASKVSSHFGKSRGFIVVDSDGAHCEYLDTKQARQAHECAPIRALADSGSRVILCRSMGRGALVRSHEAGLRIYTTGESETVADVLAAFRTGQCPDFPDSALCSHAHHDQDDHGNHHAHDHNEDET
jgi:predicted Fe-Mo cluster-binding NifX family protein